MVLSDTTLFKRAVSILSAGFLMAQMAVFPVSAEQQQTPTEITTEEVLYTEQETYSHYFDRYSGENRPEQEIFVSGNAFQMLECSDSENVSVGSFGEEDGLENRDDILIWDSADGMLTYEIDVPETGIYAMEFSYSPIPSAMANIEFSIAIDGEIPYDSASRATLNKIFVNDGEITFDAKGNQIRPSQKQVGLWLDTFLMDVDGLFNDPLIFYLEKGSHEIQFDITKGYFALEYFKFTTPESIPTYAEYQNQIHADVTREATPSTLIRIEGENAIYKSDSTLYPMTDSSNYLTSPSSPSKRVYNTIGSENWSQALQTITWEIPAEQLPYDGWYQIGIKARQDVMRGFYSNRRIYIDGEVPCQELNQVKFYYDTNWQIVVPTIANGDGIFVYLEGGQDHTLTMEVMAGEIGASMRALDADVLEINQYYRKILMMTGANPDPYTDYYVHERIPDLIENFQRLSTDLKRIQQDIESLAGSEGSEAVALERMYLVLDSCIEKPLRIPDYLSQMKDDITALSSWMVTYRGQPLEIDYIEIASANQNFSPVKQNLLQSLAFSWKRFISSFFEDYTNLTDDVEGDAVNVWVSSGREQAMVIKTLTESQFIPESHVPVAVNLVVGGVVEAALAGEAPDVALFLGGEFPVNLAARGLLVDLQQFPDYEEVTQRFQENATVPYQYEGGCYGLPLSQSWAMMFYRKDILSELGLTAPPDTWDSMIDMLPALQRNYMYVGLVLPVVSGVNATISAATESGHTFATLLLQNGLNYYTPSQTQTTFDDVKAVKAFEQWTDFYTKYGFEQSYDGFSRFRTGEYPIVIADYGFFNQLAVASPEIKGLWDFTQIPATVREDGTISHAVNSNSSGAVIFNKCQNMEGAWKFLAWFTSAKVQAEYGTQIEGLLGQMGRYPTANIEALQQLGWSKKELQTLSNAQRELQEIPINPASYAVTRNIMNAFRETVNHHENPRDTLLWYNRDINTEIARKRENLGLSRESQ